MSVRSSWGRSVLVSMMRSARSRTASTSFRSAAMPSATGPHLGERMATARLLEATDERAVVGGEEQDAERMTNEFEVVELGGKLLEEVAAADVAHDGDAAHAATGKRGERHELSDERGRQVVDAEVAEVLEGVDRLAPAGAGHARDEDEIALGGPRPVRRCRCPRSCRAS